MKLFLASTMLPSSLREEFCAFVGKPAAKITVALFENAADIYPEEKKGFVIRNYSELEQAGFTITKFDLHHYAHDPEILLKELCDYDVVCFGGGNTFYLRYLMKKSGFELIVGQLLESGVVYMGGSAGAIVAGPLLNHFDAIDEPDQVPEVIWEGLHLVDFIPLPHWNTPKFQASLEKLRNDLKPYNKDLAIVTDSQGIFVQDGEWHVSP